jgi:hypothetical protein
MPLRATYIAYRLLKEALHRLAGMDREATVAATALTAGIVAGASGPIVAPVTRAMRRRPTLPSPLALGMALAVLRHVCRGIGGEALRETPYAGAIIASAMVSPAKQIVMLPVQAARLALSQVAAAWRYLTVGAKEAASRRGR